MCQLSGMTHVKIPVSLIEGVLYALDQVQYSGEWYEYQRSHGRPDRPLPADPPAHLAKLKAIREAEALILRKLDASPLTGFVYLIGQADREDHTTIAAVKVGFSKDPWRRLQQLKTASPTPLYIIGRMADQISEREREIHRHLDPHRINREWFRWSPTVKTILARAGFQFEYPVEP
jgi:hypothetical protein